MIKVLTFDPLPHFHAQFRQRNSNPIAHVRKANCLVVLLMLGASVDNLCPLPVILALR
jgi:hypothetical protein